MKLPPGALVTEVAGEAVWLLPGKAACLPVHQTLLVADAHLGKAASFRRLGVPVPEGPTAQTLTALSELLTVTQATRLVFLGDFLHSVHARAPATLDALGQWRERHAGIELVLVRGNHDDRAGDPPASLGIDCVDEPWSLGALALCHHPEPHAGAYVLAGHWHPCVHLSGRAHDRLRLPCFWLGQEVGILPALGGFTGMHPIQARKGDRVYAVADEQVVAVPTPP